VVKCPRGIVFCKYFIKSKTLKTGKNTPIHNILSTAPQLSISQRALGTLAEDGNVMPKHAGAIIHNK
jgi:hypothetical protein